MDFTFQNKPVKVYEYRPDDFTPKVEVVACYLEVEKRLLLLRNSSEKPEPETWGVPAGKLEALEALEDGAKRELWEETGISCQVEYLGALYIRKPNIDYVYHMFKGILSEIPQVSLSSEHSQHKWVFQEEAKSMPLMLGAYEALHHYYTLVAKKEERNL